MSFKSVFERNPICILDKRHRRENRESSNGLFDWLKQTVHVYSWIDVHIVLDQHVYSWIDVHIVLDQHVYSWIDVCIVLDQHVYSWIDVHIVLDQHVYSWIDVCIVLDQHVYSWIAHLNKSLQIKISLQSDTLS